MINHINNNTPRAGCQDVWNAFMLKDAEFILGSDIPICNSTKVIIPHELISYEDAKHIYKTKSKKEPDFFVDAFVHFYIDDQKFDGPRDGIWNNPYKALDIIRHFAGAITPDFSTNADFPDAIKRYNTFRMRAFGHWLITNNITVINNVRWGTIETWDYCFDGIPLNSIISIGTVASGLHKLENRPPFEEGLRRLIKVIKPSTIIVYGSSKYSVFNELKQTGINIISFPSKTSLAFSRRKEVNYE
ncbi:MAG: DUF4417 domain-containing protein [Lachnospiraceae bacterium]|nr:DUF4417 domain-containing protein [Lachnospiraceae bacterium]